MKLLTPGQSNPKTAKSDALGEYLTAILHLAPAALSGFNVCKFASKGCTAGCLNTAGKFGPMPRTQAARVRKTRLLFTDPDTFWRQLTADINSHVARAERLGLMPAIRLNGTSDLPWERMRHPATGRTLFEMFPGVQFYDYTKWPIHLRRDLPDNYALTFSLSESNKTDALVSLAHGRNVAVVFATARTKPLPEYWNGYPVIDGDKHDLRFLDPTTVVVGLRAKGRARQDKSGFVQPAPVADPDPIGKWYRDNYARDPHFNFGD